MYVNAPAITAHVTVTGRVSIKGRDQDTKWATVFKWLYSVDGQTHRHTSLIRGAKSLEEGDAIWILYHPEYPSRAIRWSLFSDTQFFRGFTIIIVLLGVKLMA